MTTAAATSKGGKPRLYDETLHTVSFKCTRAQHATFLRAGGNVFLRARLDEIGAHYAALDAKTAKRGK